MLKIQGALIGVSEMVSGTSKSGKDWSKKEFVIETADQFPKKICFTLFGDKIDLIDGIEVGSTIEVSFDVESREFNGRWYHNINANGISSSETKNNHADVQYPPTNKGRVEEKKEGNKNTDGVDDLPF